MRVTRGQIGFILIDVVLISFSFYAAFWLRDDGSIPHKEIILYLRFLPFLATGYIIFFAICGLYNKIWDFVGLKALSSIFSAVALGTIVIPVSNFFLRRLYYPRSIIIIGGILVFILVTASRFSWRILREIIYPAVRKNKGKVRVLIAGAGSAGDSLCRSIIRDGSNYLLVGFVDDDKTKVGRDIHGFKVIGLIKDIPRIVDKFGIERVIIAIPSATGDEISRIHSLCHQAKVHVSVLPHLSELVDRRISINQIREIQPEDILERKTVTFDSSQIHEYLNNKKVMITGAAGSIGSELARQVASYNTKELVLIDKEETFLFELTNKIERIIKERGVEEKLISHLTDIRNREYMERIFNEKRPDIIFHAAAYKHVPVLEKEVIEAVINNVEATVQLAEFAMRCGVKQFVYISTDKAVKPASIMGATKRVGELVIKSMNYQDTTEFVGVRFGNVFASRGSVITLFERQIREGGPVTITHPEMIRYFMTIPEAVQLILKATTLGGNGRLYILDMGDPVKIEEIAKKLILFYGYNEGLNKIGIEYTGLRPGEKLVEELHYEYERLRRVGDSKLFLVDEEDTHRESDTIRRKIKELIQQARQHNRDTVIEKLRELVPEYKPSPILKKNS